MKYKINNFFCIFEEEETISLDESIEQNTRTFLTSAKIPNFGIIWKTILLDHLAMHNSKKIESCKILLNLW